jgi:hypothetical protein
MSERLKSLSQEFKDNGHPVFGRILDLQARIARRFRVPEKFPTHEILEPKVEILTLDQAVKEYKADSNPESLTRLLQSFWFQWGQQIGKEITVPKFIGTAEDIKKITESGRIIIYDPRNVTLGDLKEVAFPYSDTEVEDIINGTGNFGWLSLDSSEKALYLGTSADDLNQIFRDKGEQGMTLRHYVIGTRLNKLLTGRDFDENDGTRSRLDSFYGYSGETITAMTVCGDIDIDHCAKDHVARGDNRMGGRGEKVIGV